MRVTVAAALVAVLSAAPALAGSHTQPASNEIAIWAYPTKENYCPAGLQPVRVGGVICCGQPTHVGYKSHPVRTPRKSYVSYGKGYDEGGYVAYGKGYSD